MSRSRNNTNSSANLSGNIINKLFRSKVLINQYPQISHKILSFQVPDYAFGVGIK